MLIADVLLIILLVFCPIVKYDRGGTNYLSKANILPIKGLSVILVFFSHYQSYVNLNSGFLDQSFMWINMWIGQLCVVMFFFYSGYGIWTSFSKNENYIRTFMRHRFLPVWLSFAICVFLFLIENALIGKQYGLTEILLSFTGWTSIGNSNWYMFVTFVLYISFYMCFKFVQHGDDNQLTKHLIIYTMVSFILVVILYFTKDAWWYNTLLCFPAGMWYALAKNKIDDFALRNKSNYFLMLITSLLLLGAIYLLYRWHGVFFIVFSIQFCFVVCVCTMKLHFRSAPLAFLGKHVFSIYILQRLVFNFGQYCGLNEKPRIYFVVCMIVTIVLAVVFDYIFDKCRCRIMRA